MPVKVSVVIPTYNPGARLGQVLTTLGRQSLPADEFEVIFVDDGSTDGTFERLRQVADESVNVSVRQIPNSGWPGRPRNVGLDAAAGQYVLFMDHDDGLFPEALERAYAFGAANHADVVLGKEVTTGAPTVGWPTFRQQVPQLTEPTEASLVLMNPHKFYRREFLNDYGIRFKEGRIRLEDYLFNFQVLSHAPVVSILADYPCYHWVHHAGQNHKQDFDESVYWRVFAETIEVVENAHVSERARDAMYQRLYRNRILYVGCTRLSRQPPHLQSLDYARMRELARTRFPQHLDRALPATDRARAHLLRADDFDRVLRLSEFDALGAAPSPLLQKAEWHAGVFHLDVHIILANDDDEPILLCRQDGRIYRALPAELSEALPRDVLDITDELTDAVAEVTIRGRTSGVEWLVPGEACFQLVEVSGGLSLEASVHARIDPTTAAFGAALANDTWDVNARLSFMGVARGRRIRAAGFSADPAHCGDRVAGAYSTVSGNLSIKLTDEPPGTRPARAAAETVTPRNATKPRVSRGRPTHIWGRLRRPGVGKSG